MKVIADLKTARLKMKNTAVAIGVFDALHTGHQKLLAKLIRASKRKRLLPTLVTFDPYPRETLDGRPKSERLLMRAEKIDLLRKEGIGAVAFLKFNKALSNTSAHYFIENLLCRKLGMKHLTIGEDFTLGKKREGNVNYLRKIKRRFGFTLNVEKIHSSGRIGVKSSLIRDLLQEGKIEAVNKLTGRYYFLNGKVIKGFGRGSPMSYPTANIQVPEKMIPKEGIYVSSATVGGTRYPSITYIGSSPTFKRNRFAIETYILEYRKRIYGKKIRIEFLKYLRDDKKFQNVEALKSQIEKDVKAARKMTKFGVICYNCLK